MSLLLFIFLTSSINGTLVAPPYHMHTLTLLCSLTLHTYSLSCTHTAIYGLHKVRSDDGTSHLVSLFGVFTALQWLAILILPLIQVRMVVMVMVVVIVVVRMVVVVGMMVMVRMVVVGMG